MTEKSKKFLCEYRFRNKCWVFEIDATSFEEAKSRLSELSKGEVLGETKLKIPASFRPRWIQKIFELFNWQQG